MVSVLKETNSRQLWRRNSTFSETQYLDAGYQPLLTTRCYLLIPLRVWQRFRKNRPIGSWVK